MNTLPKIVFVVAVAALLAIGMAVYTEVTLGIKPVMQVGISILVIAASLFVILSKRYAPRDKHWAYATVGTILGFWLPK